MQNVYQQTLFSPVSFEGIGLHSGSTSKLVVTPGKDDQGIVFKRVDLSKNNLINANFKNVSSAKLCTTLENEHGVKVSTVEHLLAALYFSGIDNAVIEIDNSEVPIMDGSAKDFLNVFDKMKLKVLSKKRKYLKVLDRIELVDGERKISIEPEEDSLEIDFQLNYKNKIIGKQKNTINFENDDLHEITSSRTFCLYEDIEKIKKAGLAKGGSLDNALVVDKEKVLNKGGLRNNKEFVNHKILDLVGDLVLSGHRILGKVRCQQGGHELSNMFLRKLMKNSKKESFQLVNKDSLSSDKKFLSFKLEKIAATA